jgi:predicted aconitase
MSSAQRENLREPAFKNLRLTRPERGILDGKKGEVWQKVMKTVALYAEACGARRMVPINGAAHMVISQAMEGLGPRIEMLEELVGAGLKIGLPFTVDPKPIDERGPDWTREQKKAFQKLYGRQSDFEALLKKLGLRDDDAFTCTCYLPQVGNIPRRGAYLAWSESSAVVFANSVLGARTNRNGAIMDLLCNLTGRAPFFGLLTDRGRKAAWLIEIKTSGLPEAQVLGGIIGKRVGGAVPYLTGLDVFLGSRLNQATVDYLKEMGAACAALGAVGLYHVENITPEACDQKRRLLTEDCQTLIIRDADLLAARKSFPVLWTNKRARPYLCLVGCPHLSLRELYWWAGNLSRVLREFGRSRIQVRTILCAAPQVLKAFRKRGRVYQKLVRAGVELSGVCSEQVMNNPHVSDKAVITNSNKLRAYTTARYFPSQELLGILATGKIGANVGS